MVRIRLCRKGDDLVFIVSPADYERICREIVEAHGGEIVIADNPGGGTLVRFTLAMAGTHD